MRVINADKYMERLRANIDTTADTVAEQLKRDEPIGTVKDGGQIGYLMALQWARNTLELDCYTIQAIPIPENATNGDVIKAMFPYGVPKDIVWTLQGSKGLDWWNTPYKGGQKDGNDD